MKIGIYSGSFNPVHEGHIALCDYLVKEGVVDEVWLIRSPLNPLKAHAADALAPDEDRQKMLELAITGHQGMKVCCIEDTLPRPNYSVNTLQALQKLFPGEEFHLIIGMDNWLIFDRWRAYDTILKDFHLIVYPRPGYEFSTNEQLKDLTEHVQFVEAPQYDISSTEIREAIARDEQPKLIDAKVLSYIKENTLYNL